MRLHFRGFTTELEDKRLMYGTPDCQAGGSVKSVNDAVHVGLIRNKAEVSLRCREGQTMHERASTRSWRHTALTRKISRLIELQLADKKANVRTVISSELRQMLFHSNKLPHDHRTMMKPATRYVFKNALLDLDKHGRSPQRLRAFQTLPYNGDIPNY